MENQQFIEIKRVLSNDDKINVSIQPEAIDVALIESFRGWHKGKNDQMINGEMTLLVLKNKDNKDSLAEKSGEEVKSVRVRTILIQEAYSQFLNRMSARVVVRRLE